MRQAIERLGFHTRGRGPHDITAELSTWAAAQGMEAGLLTVFLQHTSASLTIQENADPDVLRDLDDFLARLAPEDPALYRHASEGPDDMPAHIRAMLTQTQLAIPLEGGRLALGTWQGVYLLEHRARPHERFVMLHLAGE